MLARLAARSRSRPDKSTSRALFVAALIVLWMLGISARLVYLQVTRHEKLAERAREQQQDAVETLPQRGPLLDRQERELARSIDTTSLFIAPDEFESQADLECTVAALSQSLRLDRKNLLAEVNKAKES